MPVNAHTIPSSSSTPRFVGPLFVVGMPRSGTKLLRTIINNHSGIRILEIETEFLPYWAVNWDRFGDLSQWNSFQRFYERVQNTAYMILYRTEVGQPISARDWYESCREFSAAGVFEALVRHDAGAPRESNLVWGDKSPSYVRSIPLLKKLYPQARIIHIRRDVRDYCLSLNKAMGKDMLRAAQRWADDVAAARLAGQKLGRDYLEVRYEDLISDPDRLAAQACAFVGRDFEPQMTTLSRPAEQTFETMGGAGSGLKVILGDNMNKWRDRLDPRTVARIEAIAYDAMRSCQYPVTVATQEHRLSSLSMAVRQLLDGFNIITRYHRFDLRTTIRLFWNHFVVASPALKPWQRKLTQ